MSQEELKFGNFIVKLNWLYEAIVSTNNQISDGGYLKYNAAPMGVIFTDKDHLIIRPFINTNTFKNIRESGNAGVNFTNDVSMFYKSAIKKSELSPTDFIMSKRINSPLLKDVKTRFEVVSQKISIDEEENRATIECKILNYENIDSNVEPYSRGDFSVLESIIHFTRINFLIEEDPSKGKKLISRILDYDNFVKRTYPGSNLEKIMNELVIQISKMEQLF